MSEYFGILGDNLTAIIILFIAVVIAFTFFILRRAIKLPSWVKSPKEAVRHVETPSNEVKIDELSDELSLEVNGHHKAMIIEWYPEFALNLTNIDKPIGSVNQILATLPKCGTTYVVKQSKEDYKQLLDCDYTETPFKIEMTPQWAYKATHWPVLIRYMTANVQVWKSPALWLAILIWAFVGLWGLVLIGG